MRPIILILLLTTAIFAKSVEYWDNEFRSLSQENRNAIIKTFVKAIPDDLSYSLAAIHFKESYGDKYEFNINHSTSIDVGSFMINSLYYLKRQNLTINEWNTARALEELSNYDTNFLEARNILLDLIARYPGNWRLVYQRYNGGWSNSQASKDYAQDIINIQKVLKKYLRRK